MPTFFNVFSLDALAADIWNVNASSALNFSRNNPSSDLLQAQFTVGNAQTDLPISATFSENMGIGDAPKLTDSLNDSQKTVDSLNEVRNNFLPDFVRQQMSTHREPISCVGNTQPSENNANLANSLRSNLPNSVADDLTENVLNSISQLSLDKTSTCNVNNMVYIIIKILKNGLH